MLQNEVLVAQIGVVTSENGPRKGLKRIRYYPSNVTHGNICFLHGWLQSPTRRLRRGFTYSRKTSAIGPTPGSSELQAARCTNHMIFFVFVSRISGIWNLYCSKPEMRAQCLLSLVCLQAPDAWKERDDRLLRRGAVPGSSNFIQRAPGLDTRPRTREKRRKSRERRCTFQAKQRNFMVVKVNSSVVQTEYTFSVFKYSGSL